eukprot:gene4019-14098_t
MKGINTPELKPPKSMPNREEEVAKAKEAQAALSVIIMNKVVTVNACKVSKAKEAQAALSVIIMNNLVTVKFFKAEKYGRQLVQIWNETALGDFTKEKSVNQEMVARGLAVVFMDD